MAEDENMTHEFGANELMIACEAEDTESAMGLLDSGIVSVTEKDKRGRNALHYCAEFNSTTEIAEALLKRKSNLTKVKDKYDVTPLHLAVISGNTAMCVLFLNNRADVNALDKNNRNVVHMASANGHADILQLVADKGAKLNKPDKDKIFALHYAVQVCADESSGGGGEKKKSKDKGKKKDKDKDKRNTGDAAYEVLAKLLVLDTDHNCRDGDERTPLIWAASYGIKKAAEMILDDGAAIDSPDRAGMTALHAAVAKNQEELVNFLLKLGAKPNIPDKKGCTPLFYAVSLDLNNLVNALLRHNANPNHQDTKGRSPAHCAAARGNTKMLTLLLQSETDLWLKTVKGDYPIHEAALAKENETVRFILDVTPEADAVDRANNTNTTCLHLAAIANNSDLCKLLLKKGASKDVEMTLQDGAQITPHQAALLKHCVDAAEVLETRSSTPVKASKAASVEEDPVDYGAEDDGEEEEAPKPEKKKKEKKEKKAKKEKKKKKK